jgi:four helix bundle protein
LQPLYERSEGGRGRVGEGARGTNAERIKNYGELRVYRSAFEAAMRIFEISKSFPREERYSLIDQVRRSSRSVCTNIAEAWRKRRYEAHFVSKLSDAESEAEETRVWLAFALSCKYADAETVADLDVIYDRILAQLVTMISSAQNWAVPTRVATKRSR